MKLSQDQCQALKEIHEWWANPESQTFTLAGFAGTGKTSTVAALRREWSSPVLIGAPTGKAALRLREKGVKAHTIHHLCYSFAGKDEHGDPEFDYVGFDKTRSKHRKPDTTPPLLIVDEASMVNTEMHRDLMSSGYRVLFVGDHGQLPPVGGDPGIMRKPNFALSEIHRQDDAGLLDFAHALRQGTKVPEACGAADTIWLAPGVGTNKEAEASIRRSDVAICWMNTTRHRLNRYILWLRGMIEDVATSREATPVELLHMLRANKSCWPMLVLRNDYQQNVANGEVLDVTVQEIEEDALVVSTDDGRKLWVDLACFGATARGTDPLEGHVFADFGFCLTAHKAQGSEWPWVTVWDDTNSSTSERPRWSYTAATRAQNALTWVHR